MAQNKSDKQQEKAIKKAKNKLIEIIIACVGFTFLYYYGAGKIAEISVEQLAHTKTEKKAIHESIEKNSPKPPEINYSKLFALLILAGVIFEINRLKEKRLKRETEDTEPKEE